jgi:multiple sugar transport system substrate-binding protein
MKSWVRKTLRVGVTGTLAATTLAACSSSGGPPSLTWFINPDNGGQIQIAKECTAAAKGEYKITTSPLPTDATQQRQQLVTRLSAKDSSISLMSIDPVYVPELSYAGFLAKIPAADATIFSKDIVKPAVDAASWQGKLVAAPFYANVQLLWFYKSVAQQAGLDMTKPVTWDQLIAAARKTKTTIGVQADQYEGYTVLINALISGAGGKIVENPGAQAKDVKLGLDTKAGEDAVKIIEQIARGGIGGPALSTAEEGQSLTLFTTTSGAFKGGFLANWPYVWSTLTPAQKKLIGFTVYPQTVAGTTSKPPFGGIDIAVGAYTHNKPQAFDALKCITSAAHQAYYMVHDGNPAANETAYTDPAVLKAYPNGLAAMILKSLKASGPRPQSQYYGDLSAALQQSFSPPNSVNSSTPKKADDFILKVLKGEKLL